MSDLRMSDLSFSQRSFELLGEAVRLLRMVPGLSHREMPDGVGHDERERAVNA